MKEYLRADVGAALLRLNLPQAGAGEPASQPPRPAFEKPRQAGHGDLTTNIAMTVARGLRRKPRELADRSSRP